MLKEELLKRVNSVISKESGSDPYMKDIIFRDFIVS